MDRIVIGVAGGSASGKTTVSNHLKEVFCDMVQIICHDWYYKAHDELTYEERTRINYDHPSAFDNDLFLTHLKALKNGESIEHPVYDYTVHNRSEQKVLMASAKVIIVDGFLIYSDPEIRDMIDIKVFVDTDADERVIRRILRDVKERGRSLDSVITQYLETVKPMHEQFVEPSKKFADIIIPRGGENKIALEMLDHRIRNQLNAN